MNYNTIKYIKEDNIGIIKLNRPERMNAVIEEMYSEIKDVLEYAQFDSKIRVLILTGSVLKKGNIEKQAFCAGADLKEHSSGKRTYSQKRAYIMLAHETTQKIYEFPKPIIAAINGPARGAGAEMAVNCDFIIMAEEASIGFPETGLGTFTGGGVTHHLPKMIGIMKAKELIYLGRIISGKEAVDIGLALTCFPIKNLLDETRAFANELAEKAPISMKFAKKQLNESPGLNIATTLLLEAQAILSCMDTEDWKEGINAFKEKRKPLYKGC
ncbi:Enoyl-CoA hydratase/isomerase family protein [Candidatus Magnetomoraceae bacterium gMMP-15]